MSVNIFGEGTQKNGVGIGPKGISGVGFKILDGDGNFDIDNKRLANVGSPESENDAVTKQYIDDGIQVQKEQMFTRLDEYATLISRIASLMDDISVVLISNTNGVEELKNNGEGDRNDMENLQTMQNTLQESTELINGKLDELWKTVNDVSVEVTSNTFGVEQLENNGEGVRNDIENLQTEQNILTESTELIYVELDELNKTVVNHMGIMQNLSSDNDANKEEIGQLQSFVENLRTR
jgi:chromosome segregation ATPase